MLRALKKFWVREAQPSNAWSELRFWAEENRLDMRDARGSEGFVIDGRLGSKAWRLEWGSSQRVYVQGNELRLRAELNVPRDLQALVLNRELKDAMESDVFDRYIEDVQTRIDTKTPPEMRWLVMYPKLSGAELRGLRERWAGVSNLKAWLERWIQADLETALQNTAASVSEPTVLMVTRGRLVMRTALENPTVESLERCLKLYACAVREAERVSSDFVDPASPSTQPSLWSPSLIAVDAGDAYR